MNTGLQIMVTGGDHVRRMTHITALQGFGCDAVEAPTFDEALDRILAGEIPHILLIDLRLSAAGARALIEILRRDYELEDMWIVAVDAVPDDQHRLAGMPDGWLNAVLPRPTRIEDLYALMNSIHYVA